MKILLKLDAYIKQILKRKSNEQTKDTQIKQPKLKRKSLNEKIEVRFLNS